MVWFSSTLVQSMSSDIDPRVGDCLNENYPLYLRQRCQLMGVSMTTISYQASFSLHNSFLFQWEEEEGRPTSSQRK